MAITKGYMEEVKRHKNTKEELKVTKRELNIAQDMINVLTQENLELNKQLKKIYEEGAIGYYLNEDGFIINYSILNPYTERTFIHEVPIEFDKAYGTTLYNKIPFAKIENGIIVIDKEQYKKYLGVIL